MKTLVLVLAALTALTSSAHAQMLDHLKCHKVKDPLKLKATADFTALQSQFSGQNCQIGKPKLFCIPATKSNVMPPAAVQFDVNGQQLENAFISYAAKCVGTYPDTGVTDQFGSRTETKYVTSFICAPAMLGTVTTTTTTPGQTTTTVPGTVPCGSAASPECNGTCPTQGTVCGDAGGGHCGCVSGAPPCGQFQGAPTCAGTCAASTPFCKDVSGTCTCSATP